MTHFWRFTSSAATDAHRTEQIIGFGLFMQFVDSSANLNLLMKWQIDAVFPGISSRQHI